MTNDSALTILKWQIKAYTPTNKKVATLKFCNKRAITWSHYLECEDLPKEVKEHKQGTKMWMEGLGLQFNLKEILKDTNFVEL